MRDFLVRSLNMIIWMVFILMMIATIGGAVLAASEAIALGALVFVAGLVFSVFVAGSCFLGTGLYELSIGIYNNTTRTAAALEVLAGTTPTEG